MEVLVKRENTIVVAERDVKMVKMLSDGAIMRKIAAELSLSKRTVENLLNNLRDEFNCDTLPHLVATFLRKKIIE